MQPFRADATIFRKKIAHENMKKGPQKLLTIGPNF